MQKSSEDEGGLEAVEKLVCFWNECVSKSGGDCGCPNRQATNDQKHGCLTCLKLETTLRRLKVRVSSKGFNSNESRLCFVKTNDTDKAWFYQATAIEQ